MVDADNISDSDLTDLMMGHYRDNWPSIADQFSRAINSYDIDDEAKDTFAEALSAHGCEFYRCPPRLLFPEIERVARAEIHGGAMDKMASKNRLREQISQLSPQDMAATGLMGTRFYSKLVEHLYAHVHDAEALEKMTLDPIPNRHVTVHGLASYKSLQSSVNSLILSDFIFHAISTIKRLELEDAELLLDS